MPDLFQRLPVAIQQPITADTCIIQWGDGAVATATNVQLSYNQAVTRRRTLGTDGVNLAVIYPSHPIGQLSIARMVVSANDDIFNRPGWNVCNGNPTTIRLSFTGKSSIGTDCTNQGGIYTCAGCVVSSYSLSAEAEGLTVIDNISIEFMQLSYDPSTAAS